MSDDAKEQAVSYEDIWDLAEQMPGCTRPTECEGCDGFGVMTLYGGPGNELEAPCLICSRDKSIHPCLEKRDRAIAFVIRHREKKAIAEHNARIEASAKGGLQ